MLHFPVSVFQPERSKFKWEENDDYLCCLAVIHLTKDYAPKHWLVTWASSSDKCACFLHLDLLADSQLESFLKPCHESLLYHNLKTKYNKKSVVFKVRRKYLLWRFISTGFVICSQGPDSLSSSDGSDEPLAVPLIWFSLLFGLLAETGLPTAPYAINSIQNVKLHTYIMNEWMLKWLN